MFGHGGGGNAPMSRNYPEMRERLRLLLNKKRKCKQPSSSKMTQQQQQPNCHRPPQTASAAVQGSSGASKAPSQHPAVQKQPVATPGTLAERAATTNAAKTQAPTKGTLAASASASNISHQSAMQLKQSTLQKSQSATQVRRYFSGFLPRVFLRPRFFTFLRYIRRYVFRSNSSRLR